MWLSVFVIVATAARAHFLFQPYAGTAGFGQVPGNVTGNFACGIEPQFSYDEELDNTFVLFYTPEWQNVYPREMVGDTSECTEEKSCGSLGNMLFCIDGRIGTLGANLAPSVTREEGLYFAIPIAMNLDFVHEFYTLQVESASSVSFGGGEYKKRHYIDGHRDEIAYMLLTTSFIAGPTSGPFRFLISVTNDTRRVPYYRELQINVVQSNEFSPPAEVNPMPVSIFTALAVNANPGELYCHFSINSSIPFGFFVLPSLVSDADFFGGCEYFQSLGCTEVVINGTSDVVNEFLYNIALDVGLDDGLINYIVAYSNRTFERSTSVLINRTPATPLPVNSLEAAFFGGLSTAIAVTSLFSILLIIVIRWEVKKWCARCRKGGKADRNSLAVKSSSDKS